MRLLPVLAGMAVAVGVAAPAYADSGADEDFISALDTAGITYDSPEQVIAAGKDVCELFGNGQTDTDIVTKVTEKNPGFTISGAARFAAIAMSAYCPERLAPSDDAEK